MLQAVREKSDVEWVPLSSGMHQLDLADAHAECLMRLQLSEMDALWSRRLTGRTPIQYLTHTVHWRDFVLSIGPGVLIPRPETEKMIDLAESFMQGNPDVQKAPWADLGTGSGAIAIGLAQLLQAYESEAVVLAVDASPSCIDCTRNNLKRLDIKNVETLVGDWFKPLEPWKGRLGGIVSNPPYIPFKDIAGLQPEVSQHEPHSALDGGIDGLADIRTLIRDAPDYLMSGAVLVLETNGPPQTGFVQDWLRASVQTSPNSVFHSVHVHQDIFGVERFVTAIRS